MALYHFSVMQVSRSNGSKVCASAAYRAGELIHDRYYDEVHDYTKKHGVLFTDIILPENAPEKFKDREILWNEVENVEKHKKAQLAYSFDMALQNELSFDENKELALKFVKENFVDKGMIADVAIHDPDRGGGIPNPHMHVLCTMRPFNEDGSWGNKQRRVYRLDEQGNRIKGKNGKDLFDAVATTDWGAPETLLTWRENWAKLVNQTFKEKGIDAFIDHRSNEERGIPLLPTIHEGPTVRAMEKKGIQTDIGNWNRMVKEANKMIKKLYKQISDLVDWIKDLKDAIKEANAELKAEKKECNAFIDAITSYYARRNAGAYSRKAKTNNIKEEAEIINFLSANKIHNLDDLSDVVDGMFKKFDEVGDKLKPIDKEIKFINEQLTLLDTRRRTLPVYQEHLAIKNKRKKEHFYQDNASTIRQYHMVTRQLKENNNGKIPSTPTLSARLGELEAMHKPLMDEYLSLRKDAFRVVKLKHAIEDDYKKALGIDIPRKHREEISL